MPELPHKKPLALLGALLILALALRLMAALDYGRDWYAPGSFTLVNFDEAGSCRAALDGFGYSPWVGWQTIALASAIGAAPPENIRGDARAVKRYCHSEAHVRVARVYSAVCGALTIAVLWLLALQLFPQRRWVPPVAAGLLALSGWHVSESLTGTVDAASTLFIYAFLSAALWAARAGGWRWVVALLLLLPAVWTKYWLFALLSLPALLPPALWRRLLSGISRERLLALLLAYAALFALLSNPASPELLVVLAPLLFYLLPPWAQMSRAGCLLLLLAPWAAPLALQSDIFMAYTGGSLEGRFGTDYGAIGWHKWLRNLLNLPLLLLVGLGMPAFVLLLLGIRVAWNSPEAGCDWRVLLPLPAFALYMLFLAPVTYYRHYLPLLPLACLLAALGISALRPRWRPWGAGLALGWAALLGFDLASDFHFDPRRELPAWYAQQQPRAVLASYYVNPPPRSGASQGLFRVRDSLGDAARLRRADTLVLSENWYDTAFANELNGPLVHDPRRLIKTTPEAVRFYRTALAGEHPLLQPAAHLRAPTFMPELLLHRAIYGSFTQFVGDIVIFRVRQ